jgi:hypothetical protein
MKNLTNFLFTLAFFGLSVICVSAQQNSASLEETMWAATPLSYYTTNYGASTATYYFKSNNQATLLVDYTIIKPPQFVVDPFTNQQKWTPAGVVPGHDENTGGTYRRTGNSVKIEFSDFIITATIKGNTMEGECTDKNTNVKTKWAAAKASVENYTADNSNKIAETKSTGSNPPTSEMVKKPSDGIDITLLTKSYESTTSEAVKNQHELGSPKKLKTGSYKIEATESTISIFGTFKNDSTFYIQIENVDANGVVNARIYRSGGEGQLKGKVDEKGNLQLEGIYIDGLNNEWSIKLNANFQNNALINGKYQGASKNNVKFNGNF